MLPAPLLAIDLWPNGVPGRLPSAPPERIEDGSVYSVSTPAVTVFAPPAGAANGTAAIVCPGGGYTLLAVSKEGVEATRWLTSIGVTVFQLKYRVAPYHHPAALQDVLQAVRVARSRAREFGVDPRRIGVVGTSAGGHVAAGAATLFDAPEGKTGATLDAVSARPDFAVLLYPVITMTDPHAHDGSRRALLGDRPPAALVARASLEGAVSSETPPAFLAHTAEDRTVPVENSMLFYGALRAAGVPAEMHLYERGAHGFGWATGLGPTSEWPRRCEEWMRSHGWLPAPPAAPGRR